MNKMVAGGIVLFAACLTLCGCAVKENQTENEQTAIILTPIDGETAVDGTLDYFTRNGFTYAANPPAEFIAAGAKSWDDPSWFPIGLWLASVDEQADADRWKDVGVNFANGNHSYTKQPLMRVNGLWSIISHNWNGTGNWETQYDTSQIGYECAGILLDDEPESMADMLSEVAGLPASDRAGRFLYQNHTRYAILHGMGKPANGDYFTQAQIMSVSDIFSADEYYGVDETGSATSLFSGCARIYYDADHSRVTSYPFETQRAGHYGSLFGKAGNNGNHEKIVWAFIENGGPMGENTTAEKYQMPELMVAAAWHSVINGARAILYFNHSFAGPAKGGDNFANPYYRDVHDVYAAPSTISIYDAAKTLNGRLQELATVIHSPFDGIHTAVRKVDGFLAGITPAPEPFSGLDAMCKWHVGEGKHYVFAASRGYMTDTPFDATFTLAEGYSGTATVLFENRTVEIDNGEFVDTFANGNAWHVYRIE